VLIKLIAEAEYDRVNVSYQLLKKEVMKELKMQFIYFTSPTFFLGRPRPARLKVFPERCSNFFIKPALPAARLVFVRSRKVSKTSSLIDSDK
jgi:hypothetical protein